MAYLIHHHGTLWFQIRVPRPLTARYGQLVRQNLQTADRSIAQALAFQLAGQWLTRFATDRMSQDGGGHPMGIPWPMMPGQPGPQVTAVNHQQPVFSLSQLKPILKAVEVQSGAQIDVQTEHKVVDSLNGILQYWRQLNPDVRTSTYKEFQTCVKEFNRTVHKRPADLVRSDIAMYRDQLIKSGLARATVGKKVGFVSTLLQTAYDAGLISHNAARGMRIPKPKVPDVKRRAFTADELQRIFTSPVYTANVRPRAAGGMAAALIPMLAIATGARLEEICQCKVCNLYVEGEIGLVMKICDEDEGQSVKTVSSRRILPLHPELVRAGLWDYWKAMQESEEEWLFPGLEPDHDGRRGGNYGKWFARYLRSIHGCNLSDKEVVFHSFRHTFKSLCRSAGLTEEIHDALTGHAGKTVGRNYGDMPLQVLKEAINRIKFPFEFPRIEI